MKRTLLFLFALIMSAGFAFSQTTIPASSKVPGVYIASNAVNQYTGATINMGNDTSVWPWSTDDGNGVAFTPVAGATYHMTFNVTSVDDGNPASGLRVRWVTTDGYDDHTAADATNVDANVYTADQTATLIPALFSNTITTGETKTYTVDFTMDGSQPADGLVGNLAIRGHHGATGFVINTIVITDDAGNMLVNYDKDAPSTIVLPPSSNVRGIYIASNAVNQYTGATINMGNDTSVWPWSTDDGNGVAFTPVAGATYHMTFNVTSVDDGNPASGLRVRWVTTDGYDDHTAADATNVDANVYTADQTATLIPALFSNTIATGETKTYTVDFTMDGSQPAGGLVGNLAIRGHHGATGFVINTIVITDADGNQLVNYDKDAGAGEVTECPVIQDFSQVADASNGDTQPGWNVSGIMDNIAAAKYLVIETSGVGDNPGGFGGIHFIFQGNNDDKSLVIDWTDEGLNDGWLAYPREDEKTVSIAINLQNVLGDQYDNFLQCTGWARIILAYYPSTGTAFAGLGFQQAYLTTDFPKPDGAVDLTGGTDFGFIFDGSISCSPTGEKIVALPVAASAYGVTGGIVVNANNEKVSVWGIDGRLLKQTLAGFGATIPMPKGIYIVKVGTTNPMKVLVK